MRREFGKAIADLAGIDRDVYLIVGDIGHGIFDDFKSKFPERYINLGLTEQSMIGVASGMALEGLKPWVYTITPFLIERPFEQVKIDINQQRANVKLVGYADYPELGPTHACNVEGIGSLLCNTRCFIPRNSMETRKAVSDAYNHTGPCFISLMKDKTL